MKMSKKNFLISHYPVKYVLILFMQMKWEKIVQFEEEKTELDRIDNLLNKPIKLPKDQIDKLVNEYQSL